MNIIRELRIKKGITQSELANACGIHQTAVSQWEKDRTLPDTQMLIKLSEYFGVSIEILMGKEEHDSNRNTVPVLGYVRAGCPIEAIENILGYEEITDEMSATGEYFGLAVKGDSMSPRICPGDIVIVRKQDYIESGEIAVVLINNLDATIKKIIKKGTGLTLVPFNNSYDPMIFSPSEVATMPVTIVGKVVELRGRF